jgi:hypothetical protein
VKRTITESRSLLTTVWQACLVIVLVAVSARVAERLLAPLLPAAATLAVLVGIVGLAVRGRRF